MSKISPIENKVSIISKDLDTAFDGYNRHFNQLATLRGWTLTLTLAYLGFQLTAKSNDYVTILPFGVILLLFMYLEAGEKVAMMLNANEARIVERIFMENDVNKFTEMVLEYEFRDLRLHKKQPNTLGRIKERIRHMFTIGAIIWYLLLIILIVGTQIAIVLQII